MSETPSEAPATDAPGDTIYICPACGTRYDEPTACTNGHVATETVPYVRSEVEAFEQAAADAAAAGTEPPDAPQPVDGATVPENAGAEPQAVAEAAATLTPAQVPVVEQAAAVEAQPEPEPAPVEPTPAPAPVEQPAAPVETAPVEPTPSSTPSSSSSSSSSQAAEILTKAAAAVEDAAAAIRAALSAIAGS